MVTRIRITKGGGCGPHMSTEGLFWAKHSGRTIWVDDRVWLHIDDTLCYGHIASPDFNNGILFYHGMCREGKRGCGQQTYAFDGHKHYGPLAPYYLRPWREGLTWYGVCKVKKECHLYRANDFRKPWMSLGRIGPLGTIRHSFFDLETDWLYFTRIGDAPERIMRCRLDGSEEEEVIRPKMKWEGAQEPCVPSQAGSIGRLVNELRDPMVFNGYLYYAYGGERGIARMKL